MKKISILILSTITLSFAIFSCGSKSDPKDVSQNFLNALTKMDYEGAKKYGTAETGKMLDMLSSFSSMLPDSVKNKAKDIKIEIKDVKQDASGEKCEVTYKNSDKENDQVLNLVKQEGKWLVNMNKDESMGAEDGFIPSDMPEEDSTSVADSVNIAEPK